jgi:hypothetical protein
MGQISNISTLRIQNKNLNLISFEQKNFLFLFQFLYQLKKFFVKKGVLFINFDCNHCHDTFFLTIELFLKTVKVNKFKIKKKPSYLQKKNLCKLKFFWTIFMQNFSKIRNFNSNILKKQLIKSSCQKLIKISNRKFHSLKKSSLNFRKILYMKKDSSKINFKNLKKSNLNCNFFVNRSKFRNLSIHKFFFQKFCFFQKNSVVINFYNLNKKVCFKVSKIFYNKFKRYLKLLFSRQNNLFFDFIKVSALFVYKKITVYNFLVLLGAIFRSLHKKKHNFYLYFLKDLFNQFLELKSTFLYENRIKGIKFLLNGKNSGKLRSSKAKLILGSVPIKTIENDIVYSQYNVQTLHGSFGFKIWVHYS